MSHNDVIKWKHFPRKAPATEDGNYAATIGDLVNPLDRRVVAGYQKNAPLCGCNRDYAALARRSGARPLWAQLCFHYDLCVSTTLMPQPHAAQNTRSVRPSATISDHNTTLQRCHYDLGDRTTLVGRSHCVYCSHTACVPWSYGDHRCYAVYMAPFHGKLECFELF